MKKTVLAVLAAVSLCALSAYSTYTEATGPNGTTVKHVAVASETSAVIANGGCINSGGGVCEQQPAQQAE
ncbi:hypothetical protein JDW41_001536 [Salmonella enterica subsp. enterica serovar Senftenberg]|nr:hypothetical protein [Salmonella enterica subsp. enterica serovar Senftenberg]EGT3112928.1 hypothetical protein [Salmonella enterica subsp. enterica serovar Senftenberg]